ncbi:MAG: hypothetical protein KAI43_02845 [Candidatus Aureabacteria bacterium]|nr:hypothetical protein [Candidatus Auribacterota bacterium]
MKRWNRTSAFFSSKGMLLRAILGSIVFFIIHFLGWREYTTILCGSAPTGEALSTFGIFKMVTYVSSYLWFWVMAPILILTAGLLWISNKISNSQS